MTHIAPRSALTSALRLPVHALGCDIRDAQDAHVARASDAPTAAALAQLVNLGESAAFALDQAHLSQQHGLKQAGVGDDDRS